MPTACWRAVETIIHLVGYGEYRSRDYVGEITLWTAILFSAEFLYVRGAVHRYVTLEAFDNMWVSSSKSVSLNLLFHFKTFQKGILLHDVL